MAIAHECSKLYWKVLEATHHKTEADMQDTTGEEWLVGFHGISTFLGYLMPNPLLYK